MKIASIQPTIVEEVFAVIADPLTWPIAIIAAIIAALASFVLLRLFKRLSRSIVVIFAASMPVLFVIALGFLLRTHEPHNVWRDLRSVPIISGFAVLFFAGLLAAWIVVLLNRRHGQRHSKRMSQ